MKYIVIHDREEGSCTLYHWFKIGEVITLDTSHIASDRYKAKNRLMFKNSHGLEQYMTIGKECIPLQHIGGDLM